VIATVVRAACSILAVPVERVHHLQAPHAGVLASDLAASPALSLHVPESVTCE
jgi:hypothetical protein